METFSLDGWPILVGYLTAYLVPLAAADTDKRLSRIAFAIRFFGSLAAAIASVFVANVVGEPLIAMAACIILLAFMMLWSAHRARDIGWSKWICLLYFIPVIGLLFWLVLLFAPGLSDDEQLAARAYGL